MRQRVFPSDFWTALIQTLLHSLVEPTGAKVVDLGSALRAIERFPKHARSKTFAIATEQAGPRGQYWQIKIGVEPELISISAHHMESFFDGGWTVLDGFSTSIAVEEANAAPQKGVLLEHSLLPEILIELRSSRKWRTDVVSKPSSRQTSE